MKKTLHILNGVALVSTIIISYLSNTGAFNAQTMASLSARYPSLFTPAPYTFAIWAFIYLGLLAFAIYQGRSLFGKKDEDEVTLQVGWWFIISCLANSFWVIAWLYDQTALSVLLMILLLFSLCRIILRTNMELSDPTWPTIVFVWWPFCYYSGWISVALIANISAFLVKTQWTMFSISETVWTIIMIAAAGIINLFITWNRNMREFAVMGAWALAGVGVANLGHHQAIVITAFVIAGVLLISTGLHGFRNRAMGPFRKRVLV